MTFKEIAPSAQLKPYIKDFYFYEADSDTSYEDIVFPSGNMEVIFNLGNGNWQSRQDDIFYTTPPIELWGQITRPLAIKSLGRNVMLGVRFYTHSAAYFFDENVSQLNNQIIDATDLFGVSIKTLHHQLLDINALDERIKLLEDYLLQKLRASEKKHDKINFIGTIVSRLRGSYTNESVTDISVRNNISPRYLNMLFSQYTGLPPKLFFKINRFKYSLNLVSGSEEKLTTVAYASGYFDQSHFIREFKEFTGITPHAFSAQASPINQILAEN